MSDDLPSAQRIWELAEQAVNIETALRFERGEPYKEAGKIARTLNHSEKRMFETMLGDGYAGYKNEQEISRQEFGPLARVSHCGRSLNRTAYWRVFQSGATRPSSQFAFPDTNERRSPGVGH